MLSGMSAEEIAIVARVVQTAAWDDLDLVVVFGSTVSGRVHAGSDVDVFLRLDRADPLFSPDRRLDLESALSSALRREVDLVVDSSSTSVVLRREIARNGVPVHEGSKGAFKRFVVDAIRAYVDLEPQLRLFAEATRARALRDGQAALDRMVNDVGR
jgi:predicted nucleotidyltransferase